jgi:Tol biopolymer transport system component
VDGNRSELWRARPDGMDSQRVGPAATADGEMDYRPAPSPDGGHVAFVTTRGSFPLDHLAILDLATGERRALDAAPVGGPMWSPDGGRLLYLDGARRLHVVRPDGTQDDVVGATWWVNEGSSFAWSPDGAWIVGHDGVRLRLIEIATGLEIRIPGTEDMRTVDWGR